MKTTTNVIYPAFAALAWLAVSPVAQAVGPDTEGNIPGSNNGEGVGVLVSRTSGVWNTGTGFEALNNLTAGNQNTATGVRALFSDINGGFNTATGVYSLYSNTAGFYNSATGAYSLANNTTGGNNTANGYSALYGNTVGFLNTATGFAALYFNTEGSANTATGDSALTHNTTGGNNTANGQGALPSNTTGSQNTANGAFALANNTTGDFNTAIGDGAGALITGNGNVCIGASVPGEAGVNNTTWIRNVNTTQQSPAAGVAFVTVRLSDGRLGYQPPVMRSASSGLQDTAEELKSALARQEATIAQQQKQIEALTAGLQKISAQIEASKPAPQVVNNNQ